VSDALRHRAVLSPSWSRLVGGLYGRLAEARRAAYERHPERRCRLACPVISVGNLVSGGSGKTPVVAYVASLLEREGERPAVLSRGYGRRRLRRGVVIVSDGTRVQADVDRAGDEPLMLAKALTAGSRLQTSGAKLRNLTDSLGIRGPETGVGRPESSASIADPSAFESISGSAGVFVAANRYEAGRLAETEYGATVHLLDDGFQHVKLERDVDLVVVAPRDLEGEQLLPWGRLREPVETIRRADALLVGGSTLVDARALAARWGVPKAFLVTRTPSVPRLIEPYGAAPRVPRSAPILAVAGIARPQRFLDDLAANGWTVADALIFRDHHRFGRGDLARIARRARQVGAALVLTTEKDVMRLMPWRPLPFPLAWVPLAIGIEPADDFRLWLRWRVAAARSAGERVGAGRPAGGRGD
jgi:tetraacyldisaccharide 4'-kinase